VNASEPVCHTVPQHPGQQQLAAEDVDEQVAHPGPADRSVRRARIRKVLAIALISQNRKKVSRSPAYTTPNAAPAYSSAAERSGPRWVAMP
jgi:hypothetical protein